MAASYPDFLIVGAMKAGTTSLAFQLRSHPQVAIPAHEVHYFDSKRALARGLHWYREVLEAERTPETRVIGEKTPTYCFSPAVAQRIHMHAPNAKLLWSFRNPVDRTYSNYLHAVKRGGERRSFEDALAMERAGKVKHRRNMYLLRSRYAEQLERFLKFFPLKQMRFVLFEDLIKDPLTIRPVLEFLGVDANGFRVPREPRNRTVLPRSKTMLWAAREMIGGDTFPMRVIHRLSTWRVPPGYPKMHAETRANLEREFRADNEKLARLIGRDLSIWQRS